MARGGLACAFALLAGCQKTPDRAVCGLHSAAAPVVLEGQVERVLSVGSRLSTRDRISARGPAVLECFGGAVKFLDGDRVTVGELAEARLEGSNVPVLELEGGKLARTTGAPRIVAGRYFATTFTPKSALEPTVTDADYLLAFFAPNGIDRLMEKGRPGEGPRRLPPPPHRAKVPQIHAGALGEGGPLARVDDGWAVAETDELATAVLLEDRTIALGRARRLLVPDGAEVELELDGARVEIEGPADVRLR